MDVSDLRKRILRALDDARKDAAARRQDADEAAKAYDVFLTAIAAPMMRQAAQVLKSITLDASALEPMITYGTNPGMGMKITDRVPTAESFSVHTPGGSVRLASDHSPETFIEFVLQAGPDRSEVVGRVSVARGRQRQVVEERPIVEGKPVTALTEEDVSTFLVGEIPKLVVRR